MKKGIEAEKQAQFEKDKAAFDHLPAKRQERAVRIARAGFWARRNFAKTEKVIPGVVDQALYSAVAYSLKGLKFAGEGAKKGITGGASLGKRGVTPVIRIAFPNFGTGDKKSKAGRLWDGSKKAIGTGLKKTGGFLEYYAVVGLYRGTRWILNPTTPSGKPLLRNKTLNRAVGMAAAVGIFAVAAPVLVQLELMAKVWHAQIAAAGLASTAPLYVVAGQQAFLHTAVSVGMTLEKFVLLPIIAASRDTFKSSRFVQGVSYQYNMRLKEFQEQRTAQQKPGQRRRLKSVKVTMEQLVEKSSPEFYRARMKHYQDLRKKDEKPAPPPKVVPPPAREPKSPGILAKLKLGPAFGRVSKPFRRTPKIHFPKSKTSKNSPDTKL